MTRHIAHAWPPPPAAGPPFQPYPQPPTESRRRGPVAAAAVLGAVLAAVATAAIAVQSRPDTATAPAAPAPVTVTVPAPKPAPPSPLPTEQANRQTCDQGLTPAEKYIDEAQAALATLPSGVKVGDLAIPSNPAWNAATQRAATAYRQASDVLNAAIAPGTTPMLAEAAATDVKELRLLSEATRTNDTMIGNAGEVANASAKTIATLCDRFAP